MTEAVIILINIGMFIYSNKLWRTIKNNDLVAMKTFVKIGCYIMAGLELLAITAAICSSVLVLILSLLYIGESGIIFTIAVSVLTITILLCVIFIIFISLLIHGVRKMKARLVNIYIIFRITVFFIYTVLVFILIILALVAVAGWMKWMQIDDVIDDNLDENR